MSNIGLKLMLCLVVTEFVEYLPLKKHAVAEEMGELFAGGVAGGRQK